LHCNIQETCETEVCNFSGSRDNLKSLTGCPNSPYRCSGSCVTADNGWSCRNRYP